MKQSVNIMLSGGGTGGHIYPAIAIANELKERYPESNFLFVGAKGRMEMEKVPQSGYEIKGLNITGIQRSLSLKNLTFPFKLLSSLINAKKIIKNFKPNVVIGTGGFASGPTLFMANRKNIPSLIQEQNSYPGITNRLLAKKVQKICVAYDGLDQYFPKEKLIKTGNPVRQDLLEIDKKKKEAIAHFNLDPGKMTIAVLGGSLGARAINKALEKHIQAILKNDVQVIWQSGKLYYDEYKQFSQMDGVQVWEYVQKMDLLYAAADLLISRAGAGSISELCIVGKPVILIPSPNVAEDHQTQNAKAITDKNAGILLEEKNIDTLPEVISLLVEDTDQRGVLSKNIKELALPNATKRIADEVDKILK
ncbi:undecaprenyldiphospho-muramoylpentapeptide beta-N-acetylglucosaminyltransferase [Lutimonas zeaxanthinifaciens]|uniref:undecaprenyldiphospho-muramoylpentapeptide beta-N-acetylglucosaminyltransferase n=1 Tax=Lutimonas zeaxanthinifaciens TaxID=3060215 RepID=UPI00265D5FE0|nr:undecaprenyldiphospho-muramoylpentapeptide beta-N-acetylglucosaminyltransferase [Lutimonas sp. YSD2104]WKK65389.1 undecaprenyldiphospho-muramoylpentapeptide beta-N-acetylglucosaminyltransferase [Lutimonas sp. YSD2104]